MEARTSRDSWETYRNELLEFLFRQFGREVVGLRVPLELARLLVTNDLREDAVHLGRGEDGVTESEFIYGVEERGVPYRWSGQGSLHSRWRRRAGARGSRRPLASCTAFSASLSPRAPLGPMAIRREGSEIPSFGSLRSSPLSRRCP